MYTVVPLNDKYANEMIEKWKYDAPYTHYDYVYETEELRNEQSWGYNRFAVLQEEDLVGELTIEFFEDETTSSSTDAYITAEYVLENPSDLYELWMGWGLKPSLCGKGLGREFIEACIEFAILHFNYRGNYVYCAVEENNIRACKLYTSMNYKVFNRLVIQEGDDEKVILQLKKEIERKL